MESASEFETSGPFMNNWIHLVPPDEVQLQLSGVPVTIVMF
jgi:hypothetical protein